MVFPNPLESPNEFHDYLKGFDLGIAVTAFGHYETRPDETSTRLDEGTASQWCERMNVLLVRHYISHLLADTDLNNS
jgi:hypothetical protein